MGPWLCMHQICLCCVLQFLRCLSEGLVLSCFPSFCSVSNHSEAGSNVVQWERADKEWISEEPHHLTGRQSCSAQHGWCDTQNNHTVLQAPRLRLGDSVTRLEASWQMLSGHLRELSMLSALRKPVGRWQSSSPWAARQISRELRGAHHCRRAGCEAGSWGKTQKSEARKL